MSALGGRAARPNTVAPRRSVIVDTADLPHPPYRVPLLGDVVGINPRTPFQSSLAQTRQLGPISARKIFGAEMVAVSGLDLVAEVHDETRFAKYVGFHMTSLRRIVGDALLTAERNGTGPRTAIAS